MLAAMTSRRTVSALLLVLVATLGFSAPALAGPGQSDETTTTTTTAPDGERMPVDPAPDTTVPDTTAPGEEDPVRTDPLPATGPDDATQVLAVAGLAALGLGLVAVGSARRVRIRH